MLFNLSVFEPQIGYRVHLFITECVNANILNGLDQEWNTECWVRDDGELMHFNEFVIILPRLFLLSALIVLWHLSLTVFMKGKQNWYEKSIACHILRAHDIFELLANWAQTALCFRNLLLRYWHDISLALWEYFNTGLLYYQSGIGW